MYSLRLAASIVFAGLLASPAAAQSALQVHDAELAVPFGSAKGLLVLAGDQIVFISPDNPDMSLTIGRAEVKSADRTGEVVTISTHGTLRDKSGARSTFRFRLAEPAGLMGWYEKAPAAPSAAAAPPAAAPQDALASYQVKHDHRIGSCQGRLILMPDRLAFESIDDINDSRQWMLEDIKEVKQNGIYKLKVEPFLGDTFNFELVGKGMDSGEFRRLVDRIAQARTGG